MESSETQMLKTTDGPSRTESVRIPQQNDEPAGPAPDETVASAAVKPANDVIVIGIGHAVPHRQGVQRIVL